MKRPGGPGAKGGAGESIGASYRRAGPYIDASWQFVGSMLLLTLLGRWADGRFGTSPWLTVVGALLGFGTGLYTFLRVILTQADREKRERAAQEAGPGNDRSGGGPGSGGGG